MITKDCELCKYAVWMLATDDAVRCKHPENQKYKQYEDEKPVLISEVPEGCEFNSHKNRKIRGVK
jgi:hypothetical protein